MATYHDLLFKELLTTYLEDFLRLFVPQLFQEIEPGSLEFLDKELYPHQPRKRHRRSDLVARARVLGQTAHLLILLEHESRSTATFPWRLFDYFARLYEDQQIPVYPIVIYSYVRPRRPGRSSFRLRVAGKEVLCFRFHVVQLNRLRWRDFLENPNPLATALMARMDIEPGDRPRVKAECLRLLANFQLDSRKSNTIAKFIDSYLRLDSTEEQAFEDIIQSFGPEEESQMRRYVTSWEERGMEKGRLEGLQVGRQTGLQEGLQAGRQTGLQEGRQEGLQLGRLEGMKETLLTILVARFGERSQTLQTRVQDCQDLDVLKRMAQLTLADLSQLERLLPEPREE